MAPYPHYPVAAPVEMKGLEKNLVYPAALPYYNHGFPYTYPFAPIATVKEVAESAKVKTVAVGVINSSINSSSSFKVIYIIIGSPSSPLTTEPTTAFTQLTDTLLTVIPLCPWPTQLNRPKQLNRPEKPLPLKRLKRSTRFISDQRTSNEK